MIHLFQVQLCFRLFQLAASEGKTDAVEVLLDEGADIFVVDREDRSVLYWTAAKNNDEGVKVTKKMKL